MGLFVSCLFAALLGVVTTHFGCGWVNNGHFNAFGAFINFIGTVIGSLTFTQLFKRS